MSSNDTSGDLTLEDINTGEKFTLERNESMYKCGRKRTNKILTQSILASREHCIFLRVGTQLHVIDNGSANGIYINGVVQQPNLMVTLKINDIIGLGCASTVPESRPGPSTPTIYVLKVFEEPVSPDEPETSGSAQLLVNESKRRVSGDSQESNVVPCKIKKIEEKAQSPVAKNRTREARGSSDSRVSTKNVKKSPLPDIIDITDENSFDVELNYIKSDKSDRSENVRKIIKEPEVISTGVNYPENDVTSSSNDISRSLLMDDDEMNVAGVSSTSNCSREIEKMTERDNKNQCRPSVISISIASKAKKKYNEKVQSTTTVERTKSDKDVLSKRERCRKRKSSRDRVSPISKKLPSSRSKNASHFDATSRVNEQIVPTRDQSETDSSLAEDEEIARRTSSLEKRGENSSEMASDNDECMNFLVPALNLDELNLLERIDSYTERMESNGENPSEGTLVRSDENGIVQWIKYEPEITIIDNDESVYAQTNYSSDLPAPTPLKLKRVKKEAKTRYSEIDVVTLSDDDEDEDFFPASQLFGDEPEDTVKIEPVDKDIEENEGEMFADYRNEDPDIVVLTDSENEEGSLYNRVMQSQLNESRDFYIKKEPEEHNIPDDLQDFNTEDERQEIYNLCFPDSRDEINEATGDDEGARKKKEERTISVEKLEQERSEILEELKKLGSLEKLEKKRLGKLDEWDALEELKESEKLERKRLEKLKELDELKRSEKLVECEKLRRSETLKKSEKRFEEAAINKISHQDRSRDKEREDASSKSGHRHDSTEKKAHDGKYSHRPKTKSREKVGEMEDLAEKEHKAKEKKHDKRRSSGESKSARVSDSGNQRADSEDGKSNERNLEKSRSIFTEKPRSITTEKSRSICTEEPGPSISTEKSRFIPAERSRSMSTEKSRSISTEKSQSVFTDETGSIFTEKSRSILTEKSRSSFTENSTSISAEIPRSTTAESPVVVFTKVDQTRKNLQIVEPPVLTESERRGERSCSIKKVDRSTNWEEPSTSGAQQVPYQTNGHDDKATRESMTKESRKKKAIKEPGPKLTAKEKKELAQRAKYEEIKLMKEQKQRRLKNKLAGFFPPRKYQAPSFTRKERDELKNERKERLKKISDEKKKVTENNETTGIKRPVTKAMVKITEKTRNDFLVKDMEDQAGKRSVNSEGTCPVNGVKSSDDNEKRGDKSFNVSSEKLTNGDATSGANGLASSSEKKCRDKSLDVITDNLTNGETSLRSCDKSSKGTKRRDKTLDLENVNPACAETNVVNNCSGMINEVSQHFKSALLIEPRINESLRRKAKEKPKTKSTTVNFSSNVTSESSNKSRDPRTQVGHSVKSSMKSNSSVKVTTEAGPKVTKHVSFNELTTKVDFFEIEPGNTLKKCPTTDAPVQAKKVTNKKKTLDRTACPKLEEFLLRIFSWNPAWLQEQKQFDIPPPIVDENRLVPLLSKYATYKDYYNITEPLLALELWYQITRDSELSEKSPNRSPVMTSIVSNSCSLYTVPSTNIRVTTLMLEVVVSRRELDLQTCPVFGDLVFFEYASNAKGKRSFSTVFAYVEKVRQTIITPFTHYNRDLLLYVKEPYAVLSYSVLTKPLDHSIIQTNRAHRLRRISYLRSNMRMIQALQYLPASPLLHKILNPEVEDYQLPPMQNKTSLVTKDNLNSKQLEAVTRVTDAVVRKLPKICLIQGPPGTGKSKVIVNLVTEILYGDGRYNKYKKMRILVCAPSNAAIDEIVLRLLEVRKSIPESTGRFKMVRIGRIETMHPLAKNISLKVLAKKDVKTTTQNYMSPTFTIDSVEEEARLLAAKINSQKLELVSAQRKSAPDANYLAKTLYENKSKYDLLMNRRPLERIDPKDLSKLERGAENSLLVGADVITCTLTSCYTSLMESIFAESGQEISVCIVDEATQCAEAETLIPLMLGVRTLVLVGDTNQLPATIISQKAKKYGLDQSLFARIQNAFAKQENSPIIQLDTQYRMAYPVAYWPNRFFYAGALRNAANLRNLPFHFYKVINLDSTQDSDKFSNKDEATFVANLLYTLMARSKLENVNLPVRLGIITPYNNQKMLIRCKIRECLASLPENIRTRIVFEVNTVDSFQGQERDIIIMSCVRSSGIGFLSDRQRLCVALTRAKHSLILCGNFKTFERDTMWNALLADAKSRGVYVKIKATASPDDIKPLVVR